MSEVQNSNRPKLSETKGNRPSRVEPPANEILAAMVHDYVKTHCTCGYHSDDPQEHGPSAWTDRPCELKKKSEKASKHFALHQSTRERGPLTELNDQGDQVFRQQLPPGHQILSDQELEGYRAWQSRQEKPRTIEIQDSERDKERLRLKNGADRDLDREKLTRPVGPSGEHE